MNVETKQVKLSALKLNPDNPRRIGNVEMERLVKSLQEFPDMLSIREIVVDETMTVLGGNMRLLALKKSGAKECTAKIVSGMTDKQKREFVIKDNAAFGAWNFDDLANSWSDLPLADWGVDLPEDWLGGKQEAVEDDFDADAAAGAIVEPITKTGDVWLLGKHRVMCGDSTNATQFEILKNGATKYNILTDPPYNIGFNYNKHDDKKSANEYSDFCEKIYNIIKPIGFIITPGPQNERVWPKPRDKGIWIKKNATAGASVFNLRCCEPILFYGTFVKKRPIDYFDYSSGFANELTEAQRASGCEEKHAPAKPIKLWQELILMLTDDPLIDLFLGNGTTLIAAEQLGRICYGMEIDPVYCDVIIKRWETLTGKKAELEKP